MSHIYCEMHNNLSKTGGGGGGGGGGHHWSLLESNEFMVPYTERTSNFKLLDTLIFLRFFGTSSTTRGREHAV